MKVKLQEGAQHDVGLVWINIFKVVIIIIDFLCLLIPVQCYSALQTLPVHHSVKTD